MECNKYQNKLSEYMTELLPQEEMELIKNHLTNCANCQSEYEALTKTNQMLTSLKVTAPPNLWKAIEADIKPKWSWDMLLHKKFIPAYAGAGLAIFAVILSFSLKQQPESTAAEDNSGFVAAYQMTHWNDPLTDKASSGLIIIRDSKPEVKTK